MPNRSVEALPFVARPALAEGDGLPIADFRPSVQRRILKILTTQSRGVPAEFDNAWHWASVWIRDHGVTLPPDTNDTRSLRNWFCYQVNRLQNGELSARSKQLMARYGIDLQTYCANHLVAGKAAHAQAVANTLRLHKDKTGSYDVGHDADAELLRLHSNLISNYKHSGLSGRMQAIEACLPDFRFGLWMGPNEEPASPQAHAWWRQAQRFKLATLNTPAFRGALDPLTPEDYQQWAEEQVQSYAQGCLSARQRGELMYLGLLQPKHMKQSHERAAALEATRAVLQTQPGSAPKERRLSAFLGICLLVRLLANHSPTPTLYTEFCITPAQLHRILQAFKHHGIVLQGAVQKSDLVTLRLLYQAQPHAFVSAATLHATSWAHRTEITPRSIDGALALALVVIQVRDIVKDLDIRQGLPGVAPAAHRSLA